MKWNILYRGPLSSCNYSCDYCPFAKTNNTKEELADDAQKLARFVAWVASRKEEMEILFAPWGEALIRKYYQDALTTLSHLPNVRKVTIQTNLTCRTAWMDKVDKSKLSLWTTYHPSQIALDKFAAKCKELDRLSIRYTVGFVALREEIDTLESLRSLISSDVYVWANAYKRIPNYYQESEIQKISTVDPLFGINNQIYDTKGEKCAAGHTSFSVDGDGRITRCNFIKDGITNIYDADFIQYLVSKECTNDTCRCYIGYVHLEKLKLENTYEGIWERIPVTKKK